MRKPTEKMSKSDEDASGRIDISDSSDLISKKIKKAVTDSRSAITYDPDNRPGVSNLIEIHAAFNNTTVQDVEEDFRNRDTLGLKNSLTDLLVDKLGPIRDEYVKVCGDQIYLNSLISMGNERAKSVANPVYQEVRKLVGFIS